MWHGRKRKEGENGPCKDEEVPTVKILWRSTDICIICSSSWKHSKCKYIIKRLAPHSLDWLKGSRFELYVCGQVNRQKTYAAAQTGRLLPTGFILFLWRLVLPCFLGITQTVDLWWWIFQGIDVDKVSVFKAYLRNSARSFVFIILRSIWDPKVSA